MHNGSKNETLAGMNMDWVILVATFGVMLLGFIPMKWVDQFREEHKGDHDDE